MVCKYCGFILNSSDFDNQTVKFLTTEVNEELQKVILAAYQAIRGERK